MQTESANISNEPVELGALLEASPVLFSFDTIGWKILFGMIILFIIGMLYRYYKTYKKNAYRREAVHNILKLAEEHQSSHVSLISEIMFQLKQTALQTYSRAEVASLKGEEWLRFLDKKGKTTHFLKEGNIIAQALYNNQLDKKQEFRANAFVKSSIKWINTHA